MSHLLLHVSFGDSSCCTGTLELSWLADISLLDTLALGRGVGGLLAGPSWLGMDDSMPVLGTDGTQLPLLNLRGTCYSNTTSLASSGQCSTENGYH